ncbi:MULTISPECIES: AMP-binding protein [Marinobacter]|jgi:fatty-acyl-CoA synthase|uniref:Acetoacetyl-CoA synthetase / Long-chain-fatty-acid--CoA ligase n=1 Tax=Marinobacter excellens LAMA 842 TaxID=1306954 RepID=A0A137SD93_9GAMM|nr:MULTISPECIES: AMP-binding protein [Marinobacter]KXO10406.1 Acetoacetyl-CoA synthetase / Long-chain-fatty-acid--CoA ligase [Marinobacter excellens LAMA 842]MCD1630582.1 AMP-binding protein [Marinobacter shengliensis]
MSKTLPSYTSSTADKPLLGMTIGDMLDRTAERFPNNDALVCLHQDIRWTYKEFVETVNEAARAFMAIGVKRGDRVGIWSPNRYEWTVTQFATAKVGAILVNINPAYGVHELQYALNLAGITTLVTADSFKASNYREMIYELAPELKRSAPGKLKADHLPDLRAVINMHDDKHDGMWTWKEFIGFASQVSEADLSQRQSELQFDDPINIQFTSGTTGNPKGATLTHHNILNNGYFVGESQRLTENDRLVIPVPLYHCFGMVMGNLGCITHGTAMIYPGEGFDPKTVLQAVHQEKATALYGVPTMFIAELADPEFDSYDLSTLRTGIMAGSICPAEVMKKVNGKMNMKEVQIAYGMTETSPVSTQTSSEDPFEKQVTTVGRTQPHLETKIVDPGTGNVVPRGEIGELCTRGYSVMLKYWNNEEKTREAIDDGGWMHTGDLATMDEDGYIQIVGRIKDMVIRGGENIYPKEIEEFLYTHPAIEDVQVTGIPDEKYGEELIAWVKLRPDTDPVTGEDLQAFCKGKIAHFKIPKNYKFVDAFPMTVTGKIQKFKMREISIEEMGLKK